MNTLARFLIALGAVLLAVGLFLTYTELFARLRLGRLPGDIRIQRGNFSFYLPITTCVLLSLLITILLRLLRK
jgi:hypothetical protein